MSEVTEYIGERIRLYRKIKRMSQDGLAARIYKSKATVSKYENGAIAIDVCTLCEIAEALDVSITQLIDFKPRKRLHEYQPPHGVFKNSDLYLYYYDGRVSRIVRGFLQLFFDENTGVTQVTFYGDIKGFDRYKDCSLLYHGTLASYDLVTNIFFKNQVIEMEQGSIIAMNSFGKNDMTWGLITGISKNPIMPISFRCIISAGILAEDEALVEQLKLTKDDVKIMKKYNSFTGLRLV
ncbi:MAG: helix-turn-helix domain-containing protein [Clostridiales Family XIII bacterium]|jgi:transcriptional regulator with XRE-family HTH domain|nr:helix-turn-helix domain-containing protein [Clostridiales Family XIII bacterium]